MDYIISTSADGYSANVLKRSGFIAIQFNGPQCEQLAKAWIYARS